MINDDSISNEHTGNNYVNTHTLHNVQQNRIPQLLYNYNIHTVLAVLLFSYFQILVVFIPIETVVLVIARKSVPQYVPKFWRCA